MDQVDGSKTLTESLGKLASKHVGYEPLYHPIFIYCRYR